MTSGTAERFRGLHRPGRPFVLPNAWDLASALAFLDAGFTAIGTTSLGVAASAGVPDGQRATRDATASLARALAELPAAMSIDAEDGFSDVPSEVAQYVATLPVAGVNLEDSTNGRLVEPALMAGKISAVREQRPTIVINARVDNFWLGQEATVEAVLARADRYVTAGADCVFVPGRLTGAEISVLARRLSVPLNVLASEHTIDRLASWGVARVSTGSMPYRAALDRARALACLVRDGLPLPEVSAYDDLQERLVALSSNKSTECT